MTSAGSATRIDALTGVRIIAAGSVFLSHAEAPKYIPAPVQTLVTAGYNGVTLFFVLSGFVLAWSYADRLIPLRPRAVWSFFVARFARIYPLYLFALLFAATPQLVTHTLEPGWWRHVLAIQAWSPAKDTALNGPAWSIGVEFFLYACFPMVVIAVARIRWSPRALIHL